MNAKASEKFLNSNVFEIASLDPSVYKFRKESTYTFSMTSDPLKPALQENSFVPIPLKIQMQSNNEGY